MMSFKDRFDRSKRKPSTKRQRIGFALFWLVVLSYAYVIPLKPNWNAESHLFVTFSIVDHHSLNIDPYHVRLGDESFYRGHYYSDKAPGLSFLALPIYAASHLLSPSFKGQRYVAGKDQSFAIPRNTVYLRYLITYLLVVLPSALFAVLLWLFLGRLMGNEKWALALTGVYSFGTIAWVYGSQFFSHQITAMLLFASFMILFDKVRTRRPNRRTLAFTALAGFLTGYAVITEYPAVVIASLLGLYLLSITPRRIPALGAFLLGMAPAATLGLAYNVLAFGKPFAIGYTFVHSAWYRNPVHPGPLGLANPLSYGIKAPTWTSLWQITFGTYRGIFLVSPVLLLFFVALFFMKKRKDLKREFWLCLLAVFLYFLIDASRGVGTNGWSGGWSVASRHLTPILPFMFVPMALALGTRAFRLWFVVLGAVSVAVTFMAVAAGDQFTFADHNPLVHEVLPRILHGNNLVGNWGMLFRLQGMEAFVPLLLLALVLVGRIVYLFQHQSVQPQRVTSLVPELEAG
jgi:hypothetical protein